MHKIDTKTAVDGEFVEGSSSTGQQSTKLNARWFNTVQRELVNAVTGAGIALSDSDDGQLLRAIALLAVKSVLNGSHESDGFSIVDGLGKQLDLGPEAVGVHGTQSGTEINDGCIKILNKQDVVEITPNRVLIKSLDESSDYSYAIIEKGRISVGSRNTGSVIVPGSIIINKIDIGNLSLEVDSDNERTIVISDSDGSQSRFGKNVSGTEASFMNLNVSSNASISSLTALNVKANMLKGAVVVDNVYESSSMLPLQAVKGQIAICKSDDAREFNLWVYNNVAWNKVVF